MMVFDEYFSCVDDLSHMPGGNQLSVVETVLSTVYYISSARYKSTIAIILGTLLIWAKVVLTV